MIYITGDTHIPTDIQKLSSKRFSDQKQMNGNDFLVICGDFGGVWCGDNEEIYWRKWLDKKNFTTLFVDGNHENFDMLNEFPRVDFFGGKAHKISEKIYHLIRGEIYNIDGRKIFAFGGASSHDKESRKEGKNWWQEEQPSKEEMDRAVENLTGVGWQTDIVITHCAPTSVQRIVCPSYEENVLTDFLDSVKEKLQFEKWCFGHYHKDCQVNEKFNAIFDSIIKY